MSTFLNPERGPRESALARALAILWVVSMWIFTGGLITVIAMSINEQLLGDVPPAWATMLEQLIGFAPFFAAALVVPLIYRRGIATGLTTAKTFRWKVYFHGMWTWGTLMVATAGLGFIFAPDTLSFHFNASAFFPALLIGLLLLPIQTGAEEIFFRGVIPQAFSRILKHPLVITVFAAAIFATLHLANPEANSQPIHAFIVYFLMAVGWGWASYKTAGIEVSMGAHLMNNFFGLFIVGYDNSVIEGVSFWSVPSVDLSSAPFSTAITMTIWLLIVRRVTRKQATT